MSLMKFLAGDDTDERLRIMTVRRDSLREMCKVLVEFNSKMVQSGMYDQYKDARSQIESLLAQAHHCLELEKELPE